MNFVDFFDHRVWRTLVETLMHSVWQGALIALASAAILWCLPARKTGWRYGVALGGEFGVLVVAVLTWAALGYEPGAKVETVVGTEVRGEASARFVAIDREPRESVEEPREEQRGWVNVVAAGWLLGVGVMLARGIGAAAGASALARSAGEADRRIVEELEAIKTRMGIGRVVRIVEAVECRGPAVLGVVWPTIVVPAALATGIDPETLRAILAHELAHVRRHDYLMNLGQMVVEALLFFNPAVWWLGRQARVEREAACDAEAVEITGRPIEYSRALADWAERAGGLSAAMAWGGPRPSTLRGRVLRVLRPTERPGLSWSGLLALVVLGPIALFALRRGADTAVVLAAQVLSPAERVEKLKKAKAEFAPMDVTGEGKATLKGTLHAPGGAPFSGTAKAWSFSRSANRSSGAALGRIKGEFAVKVYAGVVWLSLEPKEFAPVVVGPFEAKPGATIDGIDVVFEPGFPGRVRVVDEAGKPVAGAKVSGGLVIDRGAMYGAEGLSTDADGLATFAHAARGAYRMSVAAKGFLPPDLGDVTLNPEGTTTLTIVHARPTSGVIVDPDGKPIAGATIRPYYKYREQSSSQYGDSDPTMATTDQNGRFTLDTLEDAPTYALMINAETQGRAIILGVRAGRTGLKWVVGPKRTILGTIKGDLGLLERSSGKAVVEVLEKSREIDLMGSAPIVRPVTVERVEGGGRFTVPGVLAGEVIIRAGDHVAKLDVGKTAEIPVTIDLNEVVAHPRKRRAILRFVRLGGAEVAATGFINGYTSYPDSLANAKEFHLPIQKSEVSLEMVAPGWLVYRPNAVVGTWFQEGMVKVSADDGPMIVEIKGVPAGAIVGRVVDHEGKAAVAGVSVGASTVEKPAGWEGFTANANSAQVDSDGRFFLGPLPIGGSYVANASRGHLKGVSRVVRLDGSRATERVEIRLDAPATARGRVIGSDGEPLSGIETTLELDLKHAETVWGPPTATGRDGRFQFDELNAVHGQYRANLDLTHDYQPTKALLQPGGPPVEIRLKRGHVIFGRVIDKTTGWPIEGVELYAVEKEGQPGRYPAYNPEAKTDTQGRFRFSNLAAGVYQLNDRSGMTWDKESVGVVKADRPEPVEIRATLPDWSTLKPVEPGGNDR